MLLLILTFFLHCDLLRCDEIDKVDFEEEARRNDNYTNHSITEVLINSTTRTNQTVHITSPYSFLSSPIGNETIKNPLLRTSLPLAEDPSVPTSLNLKPKHLLDSGLIPPSNASPVFIHPTVPTVKVSSDIPSPTSSPPKETSFSSINIVRSFVSANNTSKTSSSSVSYPAVTPPSNFDPSVAELAKKWLHGLASTTATTPRIPVPKLTLIFDYDVTTQRFPPVIRRNRKTQRKKSDRHETKPILREGITEPQKSKIRNSEDLSEEKTFWHNPPKELPLKTTKRTQTITTLTKQRLQPGLLLGKATISGIKNKEDVTEGETIRLGSVESKMFLRMERKITKKEWYSDHTKKQTKRIRTSASTSAKPLLREITVRTPTKTSLTGTDPTTPTPLVTTTMSLVTIKKEVHQEAYMIVFVKELTRLIATKEEKDVHDVVKHADEILHGFYKTRQLQWFCQPLKDFTKEVAKLLKESDTGIIQKQAAELYQMLRERHQLLSVEVNTILEYAAMLYDDEEGEQLLTILNEFAVFPNITLNGYWLCNSLINNFLKPYRRLTDPRQRQNLMDTVNLALGKSYTPSGFKETSVLRIGDIRQAAVPPGEALIQKTPSSVITRSPRERKRKRRHRSHKKKRGKKRYRLLTIRPANQYIYGNGNSEKNNENLVWKRMEQELASVL